MTLQLSVIDKAGSPAAADTVRPTDLHDLATVPLSEWSRGMVDQARTHSTGPVHWRHRKERELTEVLALSQVAPKGRLMVLGVNAVNDLRLLLHLGVPVPYMPQPGGELAIGPIAVIEICYPIEVMQRDLPGTSFARVAMPGGVWLANANAERGILCLGKTLPRNIPCRELILLAYLALSLQAAMYDVRDPAGVLNAEAARFWSLNQHRTPLTDELFLPENQVQGGEA